MEKYLKYKKKYYYLKIQYAGVITDAAKKKVISQIFYNEKLISDYKNNYELLHLLLNKLEVNINKCNSMNPDLLEFKLCNLDKQFKIIPNDDNEIKINNDKIDKFTKIDNGGNGTIYKGKILDSDTDFSLIKKPIQSEAIGLIPEAYINICIINEFIIKDNTSNLIFTIGLLFSEEFKINLIQQLLNPVKTLNDVINDKITLEIFVKYIKQVFNQLIILEESEHQLIHNDLHYKNILIYNDKAYIIDWGDSGFIYNEERIRGKNNREINYFQFDDTKQKKTGLYDLFMLLTTCRSCNNENIIPFIDSLLDKIFFSDNIKIKDDISFQRIHMNYAVWLYHIIGGYTNKGDNIIFNKDIYNFNEPLFTEYNYRKILNEINLLYNPPNKCR